MVAPWYDLRFETRETRVRTLLWANSGHVTTRHVPTLTFKFATENLKLSTGANHASGRKGFPCKFCPRCFNRAVMKFQVA